MAPILRVLPVFLVILVGWAGRRLGLLPPEFRAPANRLAYYLAVPCLIFLKISAAPFREVFRPAGIVAAVSAIGTVWLLAQVVAPVLGLRGGSRGTFVQASVHANLGYIGLAVAYYGLGDRGLQFAGVYAAFFMLANNFLSVLALVTASGQRPGLGGLARRIALQPVIVGSLLGLVWSYFRLPLPDLAGETLRILGSMGLPLALLLIGADLGLQALRHPVPALTSTALKNLALPALGTVLLGVAGASGVERTAAVVLLASPTATLTLVMARELRGDPGLASTAISLSTLLSAATLPLWLG
ncbi:AEC family transporter [Deferrisoma palaeochoriense]